MMGIAKKRCYVLKDFRISANDDEEKEFPRTTE